jgi:hypothetical protein
MAAARSSLTWLTKRNSSDAAIPPASSQLVKLSST